MSTSQTRPGRATELRENEAPRRPRWQPSSISLEPNPRPGIRHHWCAAKVMGIENTRNMSKHIKDGWIPCKAEDYPEITQFIPGHSRTGEIYNEDLMLCYMPEDIAQERDEYYRSLGALQQQSSNSQMVEVDKFGNGKSEITHRTSDMANRKISFGPDDK